MSGEILGEFIHDVSLSDVPEQTLNRLSLLLVDLGSISLAGRGVPASRIAADYASAVTPGNTAIVLHDNRRVSLAGAAFANAVLANALDLDDGHRVAKGHPGAVVIPAALAAAQCVDATFGEFTTAVLIGYEVAIRTGIALHARDAVFHASGTWAASGAAAAAARLLGLSHEQTLDAVSLAEFHAPMAPIMSSVGDPGMTKDACAWGAFVGVTGALLALSGFTTTRVDFGDIESDLRSRWTVDEVYVKAYPCCRWAQGAVFAAVEARTREALEASAIERVTVRTFAAADGLSKRMPSNTEQAQFNLVWPVATALVRGCFSVDDVLGPFDDADIRRLASRIEVIVDPEFNSEFPGRRLTALEVQTLDGKVISVGPVEAPGEPDDPQWATIVLRKRATLVDVELPVVADGAGLRNASASELFGLLCHAVPVVLNPP